MLSLTPSADGCSATTTASPPNPSHQPNSRKQHKTQRFGTLVLAFETEAVRKTRQSDGERS